MNGDAPTSRVAVEVLETIDDPLATVRGILAAQSGLIFTAEPSFDDPPDALKRFVTVEVPSDRMTEILSVLEAERSVSSATPEPDAEF